MELRLITYNIDGLPDKIDLQDLPWILKPIAWIYKLIKGSTIVSINEDDRLNKTLKVSQYLSELNPDIIAVQEDFNYHEELTSKLYDKYCWGTYLGGLFLSKLFSIVKWLPYPRCKFDGLNLFYNTSKFTIKKEEIIPWDNSCGYFSHANDKLTQKGFRRYVLTIDDLFIDIDIYVVHLDANYYSNNQQTPEDEKDSHTRELQFKQLTDYIISTDTDNPIIIVGDTNCYDKFAQDVMNIYLNLIHKLNHVNNLSILEVVPSNYKDCDRVFFINNSRSSYKLSSIECHFDMDIHLSDHRPLIVDFEIRKFIS